MPGSSRPCATGTCGPVLPPSPDLWTGRSAHGRGAAGSGPPRRCDRGAPCGRRGGTADACLGWRPGRCAALRHAAGQSWCPPPGSCCPEARVAVLNSTLPAARERATCAVRPSVQRRAGLRRFRMTIPACGDTFVGPRARGGGGGHPPCTGERCRPGGDRRRPRPLAHPSGPTAQRASSSLACSTDHRALPYPRDAHAQAVREAAQQEAMTVATTHGTKKDGTPITDALVEALADEAEAGYDVAALRRRQGGRPALGTGAASVDRCGSIRGSSATCCSAQPRRARACPR